MSDIVDRLYDRAVCSPPGNYCRNHSVMDEAAAEVERLRAERDALREIILGVGVNLWDKAEISDRDEAGNPTIILWHPSGMPLLRLSIESHAPHLEAAHLELVMSDLGDVFNARAALALLSKGDNHE